VFWPCLVVNGPRVIEYARGATAPPSARFGCTSPVVFQFSADICQARP
jgi:hypothetical protein